MLANNGYMTVFLPGQEGMNVFHANDVAISSTALLALQGWRDGRGLWMIPIMDKPQSRSDPNITKAAMGVYELPSTKEVVRFLHAALGYPTQATLLTMAQHGNLVTYPGMTPQKYLTTLPSMRLREFNKYLFSGCARARCLCWTYVHTLP